MVAVMGVVPGPMHDLIALAVISAVIFWPMHHMVTVAIYWLVNYYRVVLVNRIVFMVINRPIYYPVVISVMIDRPMYISVVVFMVIDRPMYHPVVISVMIDRPMSHLMVVTLLVHYRMVIGTTAAIACLGLLRTTQNTHCNGKR
jgi:hypothetical protein